MQKTFLYWVGVFIVCSFPISCTDGDKYLGEPKVSLNISNKSSRNYHKIYGLGGNGEISDTTEVVYLLLNLNKDTTTYIFQSNTLPNDTLTLVYQRKLNPYDQIGYGCKNSFSMSIENLIISDELTSFDNDEIQIQLFPRD
jgi:hypothetical protein